jgi:cytochrome c oxidase subunit 2
MNIRKRFKLAITAALPLVLILLTVVPTYKAKADNGPRVIHITAKRFGFTPDKITLKAGEPVKLVLHSEDVTHGFFMRKLKIDETIEPGKNTEVMLTPDTPGTYTTICDHFCGVNHGNMNMTIVVE